MFQHGEQIAIIVFMQMLMMKFYQNSGKGMTEQASLMVLLTANLQEHTEGWVRNL